MSYSLKTESHGQIIAGYTGPYVQEISVGEYSFPTELFCHATADIANGEVIVPVRTTLGGNVRFKWGAHLTIGKYCMSHDEFSSFAKYVFDGGIFGWDIQRRGWQPPEIKKAQDKIRNPRKELEKLVR